MRERGKSPRAPSEVVVMGYVRYLGHAAFEIFLSGKRVLVDPWLTNPLSPVKPGELTGVDIIVVTHDHGDHVGEAAEILKRNPGCRLVAVYETAERIGREARSGQAIGANIGGTVKLGEVEVVLVPAVHSSSTGSPAGAVIVGREGAVYHAGDTGLTMDMKLVGELYSPRVALLPIGGHFTMGPREAAKAVELIQPEIAVPMHYGTFPVLWGKPEEFKKLVEERGLRTRVVVLKPGEKLEL